MAMFMCATNSACPKQHRRLEEFVLVTIIGHTDHDLIAEAVRFF